MGHDAIGIRYDGTVVNAVEYQLKQLELVFYPIKFIRLRHMLVFRHPKMILCGQE